MNGPARLETAGLGSARLETVARGLLGPGIAVVAHDPRLRYGDPLPAEDAAVAGAIDRRRLEFAAGRAAARRAMAALGTPARAVPAGPDRAPIWPIGLIGSISHTADACVAAVAEAAHVTALGLDLEPAAGLDPTLWAEICTDGERTWLATQAGRDRALLAKLIFSAKEAAYKAQYPITGALLGFDAVEIVPDLPAGRFTARFRQAVPPFAPGATLPGRFSITGGLIVATVVVRRH